MPQPQPTGEDRFVQHTLELAAWAQRNTRALVLGIAALAIVGFSIKYYFDYKHRVNEAASTELRSIRYRVESGDPSQAVDQLRSFIVQYSGSNYAQEGRVLLAYSLLLQNRASEAIEPARQAVVDLKNDILSMRAAFLLAAADEEVGDTAGAISVYEDIGQNIDARVEKSRALQSAARLKAASGDPIGAAAIFDTLAEITPEDAPAHGYYVMRAAELRAHALVAAPSEPADSTETG